MRAADAYAGGGSIEGRLELDGRAGAVLRAAGFTDLERLASASDEELLAVRGIGPTRLRRVRWALLRYELERPAPPVTLEDLAGDAASARRVIAVLRREEGVRGGRPIARAWGRIADAIERDFPTDRARTRS